MAREIASAPSIGLPALQTAAAARVAGAAALVERWLEAERDQLPLWLPVALGAGIAAWFVLPHAQAWLAFAALSLGLAAAGLAAPRGSRLGSVLSGFGLLAALGVGLIWWRAEAVRAPVLTRPVVVAFSAAVEAAERLPARGLTRLTLRTGEAGLPPRLRVNVEEANLPAHVDAGARVRLRARLMPPPPAAVPGAYDFARRAWFLRLGATGRALGPVTLIAAPEEGWRSRLARLRTQLTTHVQASVSGSAGGIAASLVTGDQGGIAEADAEALRASGLAHLLSISGLHISAAVAAAMLLTLRLLALSPRAALHWPLPLIAAAVGAAAGILYTLLSGADVPAVRAGIAAVLVLIGIALGREALTLRLVAAGAMAVLLLWPESLVSASFQLSFAAVTAIVALHEQPRVRTLLARREEGLVAGGSRVLLSLLLTGLVVEVALAPIALFHFHRAGLYGALANILAIPLTTFVVMPLEALALLLDAFGGGAPIWWLVGQAVGLLLRGAHLVAGIPGAVAALPTMATGAFALMVAGGLWIALWRTRWRWLGMMPGAIGAAWAIATPPPDLIVTADGRHLAVRTEQGGTALLRPRAGDYVRDTLAETSGGHADATMALDDLPSARCGGDLCTATLFRGGRRWRVLATRSPSLVPIDAMNRACAEADIIVSDRRLPTRCRPRWLKLDRVRLAQTGGVSVTLASGRIVTTRGSGSHPWAAPDAQSRNSYPSSQRKLGSHFISSD